MDAINKGGYEDVPMTRRRAQLLAEYADKLAEMLEAAPDDKDLAEWVQSKIDRAAAAIQSAYHYLDQEEDEDLEKAVGHKYTHRKLVSRDQKTGRARYRYYYAEHQGGGISRAKFEAGSAFKLTWKGRRGHFHIDRVEGDQVFITHDSRPDMKPKPVQADELRALLKKQHSKAEQKHVEKRRKEVEEIKRRGHKGGLGLALHRLRQAAAQAGVSLPEQYQRKPKKTRAQVTETPREQLTSTAQQIIEEANQEHEERHDEHRVFRDFELGEHTHTKTGQKLFTALQKERTDRDEYFRRVAIAKKHGGRYERRYVRGFVFKSAEDARNFALEVEGAAQPEESAETVTLHEDHPGKDNFETMPEVEAQPERRSKPSLNRYKRALKLAKKGKRQDKLTSTGRRSKESRETDQTLIKLAQEILEKDLGDVEIRTIYRKPTTMWTREEGLKVAISAMAEELRTRQRALGGKGGAELARELRADARERLIEVIQEHVDRFLPDEVIDARLDRDLARDARETAKQEAREAQEARQYQQQTFTPEIQNAIDNIRHPYQKTRVDSFESHFKTRKDGGVFRATLTPKEIAVRITSGLPREINQFIVGKNTLSSEIVAVIEQGLEGRRTPAELKDTIGEVITAYAKDNAVIDKDSISSSKAVAELRGNITALKGTGLFEGESFAREKQDRRLAYIGLERLKKDMGDVSKRVRASLAINRVFTRRLNERMQRYEAQLSNRVRFNSPSPEVVVATYAEAYPTVGDIRGNISEIRDELRVIIKEGLNQTAAAIANPVTFFDQIKSGYEKATEQKNKDREGHLDRAKKLAQYTESPQSHLAEIQERERRSSQEISDQLEINREFANGYIHEAAEIIEEATESTKGELIDNLLLDPRFRDSLKAPIEGKANRKLMARIFNEIFEQVRREIEDEPIERGENHPRNIADTVRKPSKTPAQFRGEIESDKWAARERVRAKREARRAQKSALHLIDYRASLLATVERLAS